MQEQGPRGFAQAPKEEAKEPLWKRFGNTPKPTPEPEAQQSVEPAPTGDAPVPAWKRYGNTPAPVEPAPVQAVETPQDQPQVVTGNPTPQAPTDDLERATPNQDAPKYLDTTDDARAARSFANTSPRDGIDVPTNSTLNAAPFETTDEQIYELDRPVKEPKRVEGKIEFDPSSADLTEYLDSTMWEGYSLEEAEERREKLLERDDVELIATGPGVPGMAGLSQIPGLVGFTAVYTNPEGRKIAIPTPEPDYVDIKGVLKGLTQAIVPGGVTAEEVFDKAVDAIVNPGAKVSFLQNVRLGSQESAVAVGALGASIVDVVAGTEFGPDLEKSFSYDSSKSTVDALVADGVPTIAAGGGAGGLVLKTASKFLSRGLAILLSEVAASSTVSTDEGNLLFGPDGMLGDGINFGDSNSASIVEHRVNTLFEGIIAGGVMTTGAKTVRSIFNMGKWISRGLTGALTQEGIEKEAFLQIRSVLTGIGQNASQEQMQAASGEVARIIRENKEVFFDGLQDFLGDGANVNLDTFSTFLRGVRKEGADDITGRINTNAWREFNRISRFFQGFSGTEYADFDVVAGNTSRAIDETFGGMEDAFGGVARQDKVPGVLATRVQGQVNEIDAGVKPFADQLALQEQQLVDEVMQNPIIGDLLNKTLARGPISRAGIKTETREGMEETIRTSFETLRAEKDRLYEQISGGHVNGESLFDAMEEFLPTDFLKSTETVKSFTPIRKLFSAMKNAERIAAEAAEEGGEEVNPKDLFQQWLDAPENSADFGFFYNKARPELRTLVDSMYRRGDPGADGLSKFIRYIEDDMLDEVSATTPGMRDKVDAAKDFFKDQYAPLFGREGAIGQYPDIYNRTLNRGRGEAVYATEVDGMLQNQLSGSPFTARQLQQVFSTSDRPEAVMDYLVFDFVEEVAAQIDLAKGIENFDKNQIGQLIRPYAEAVAAVSPTKAAQLDDMIVRIQRVSEDTEGLKTLLEELTAQADAAKQTVMDSEVRFFLNKTDLPDVIKATSNSDAAFNELFRNKESVDLVRQYMESAKQLDPGSRAIVNEGLRVAYSRHLRASFLGKNMERGGKYPISQMRVQMAEDGNSQVFEIGRVIFADKPQVMEAVEGLVNLGKELSQARSAKPNGGDSSTAVTQRAMAATNKLLNTTLGQLSKASARIRSGVRSLLEMHDVEATAVAVMDKIISDPDYYLELHRRFNDGGVDPKLMPDLVRFFTSATVKADVDREDEGNPGMLNGISQEMEVFGSAIKGALQ